MTGELNEASNIPARADLARGDLQLFCLVWSAPSLMGRSTLATLAARPTGPSHRERDATPE